MIRGHFLCLLRYGGLKHKRSSPAMQCSNRVQCLKRRRASRSPTPMSEESVQPPSASPSASSSSSTPPSGSSPSTRVTVTETSSSASHSPVSVEGIGCSASTDGAHCTPQDASFPIASCISGPFNSDQRIFGVVADPMQTGFWSQVPSQQTWVLTPPTQLTQSITPSIQDDSDLKVWPANSHGNNILSYSGISGPPNMVPAVSSVTGAVFTMICLVPHCCFQCQPIVDMWKHVTWTHLQYEIEGAKY